MIVFVAVLYVIKLYTTLPNPHVFVNLSRTHQNIMLSSGIVYYLNGVAYDFYSVDEINSRSGPRLQWKTFPLPNEHLPADIFPWTPSDNDESQPTSVHVSVPPEITTGLPFVDHIYIPTLAQLTDRQNNLERILTRYQITNYEWRMNWTYFDCNVKKRENVYKKLNLEENKPMGKIILIFLALFLNHL